MSKIEIARKLTGSSCGTGDGSTVGVTVGNNGSSIGTTSLVGAIAKTVQEVGLGAKAGSFSGRASESRGHAEHVVHAKVLRVNQQDDQTKLAQVSKLCERARKQELGYAEG